MIQSPCPLTRRPEGLTRITRRIFEGGVSEAISRVNEEPDNHAEDNQNDEIFQKFPVVWSGEYFLAAQSGRRPLLPRNQRHDEERGKNQRG